jgi:hypothetical protein
MLVVVMMTKMKTFTKECSRLILGGIESVGVTGAMINLTPTRGVALSDNGRRYLDSADSVQGPKIATPTSPETPHNPNCPETLQLQYTATPIWT